jgi:inner membrane protein
LLAQDIERFDFFSNHFIARVPDQSQLITDVRYSHLPWTSNPLWALEIDYEHQDVHAKIKYFREYRQLNWVKFWDALLGREGVWE